MAKETEAVWILSFSAMKSQYVLTFCGDGLDCWWWLTWTCRASIALTNVSHLYFNNGEWMVILGIGFRLWPKTNQSGKFCWVVCLNNTPTPVCLFSLGFIIISAKTWLWLFETELLAKLFSMILLIGDINHVVCLKLDSVLFYFIFENHFHYEQY